MPQANEPALRRLQVILRSVRPRRFNMDQWEIKRWWPCGTQHCAIGFAMLDPWFNAHGFSETYSGDRVAYPVYEVHGLESYCWTAIENFFGLSARTAYWLFSGASYPANDTGKVSPDEVIKRIDQFLADRSAPHDLVA
jgi:hypothetical protein